MVVPESAKNANMNAAPQKLSAIFLFLLLIIGACNKTDEINTITTIQFPEGFTQEFEATNAKCHQTFNEVVIDLSNNSNIRIIITLSGLEAGKYSINQDFVFAGITPDNEKNEFKATAVLVINDRNYFAKSGDILIEKIAESGISGSYEILGFSDDYYEIQIYIKDGIIQDVPIRTVEYGEVKDFEGHIYKTVQIGNQTWMAENLRSTIYSDGSEIESIYTYPDQTLANSERLRVFYLSKAISVSKNVCPAGWHVPSNEEWTELVDYQEDEYSGALKLKTTTAWGDIYYGTPPEVSLNTNSSGMTIEPTGYVRGEDIYLEGVKHRAIFWTNSYKIEGNDTSYIYTHMNFTSGSAQEHELLHANDGYTIRCIKDK